MKLMALLSILLVAAAVHARPVRELNPNQDVEQAQVVAVVKIESIMTTAVGVQFGQFRVDELNISGSVLHAIKSDFAVGDTVNFLHRKAAPLPDQTVIVNGFSSFRFQPGHNYLLILVEHRFSCCAIHKSGPREHLA